VGGKVDAQSVRRQGGTIRSAVRTRGKHGLCHRDMVQTMDVQRSVITPVIVAAVWGMATREASPTLRPCVYKEGGPRSHPSALLVQWQPSRGHVPRGCA